MLASRFHFKRFCKRFLDASVSRPLVRPPGGPRQKENGKDHAAWQVSPRLSLAAVIVGALRYTQLASPKAASVSMSCASSKAVLPVPAAPVTMVHLLKSLASATGTAPSSLLDAVVFRFCCSCQACNKKPRHCLEFQSPSLPGTVKRPCGEQK